MQKREKKGKNDKYTKYVLSPPYLRTHLGTDIPILKKILIFLINPQKCELLKIDLCAFVANRRKSYRKCND